MTDPEGSADEPPPADGDDDDEGVEALLSYMRDHRAFDFTGYKRASLVRRIRKRMQDVDAPNFSSYLAMLEAEPGEFVELFDTILINVTAFRRDPEAWAYVVEQVIPQIASDDPDGRPIRCWSAGCASGEEPYTLAVLLCDAIGEERFRRDVKIYATDADSGALEVARAGTYPQHLVAEGLGEDLTSRYFEVVDDRATFRQDLRRSIIFGRHDLLQDPPISKIDLLVCRNTLMYFTADIQRRVLANFHFAVKPDGFLFLGKAEALVTRTNLFRTVDLKSHVFQKNGQVPHDRPSLRPPDRRVEPQPPKALLDASFEQSPTAQLVVDADENLVLANRQARLIFGIGTAQVGRPLRDVDVSFRPVELRSILGQVMGDGQPVILRCVEHRSAPERDLAYLDVQVLPIRDHSTQGALITYTPVGHLKSLQDDLDRAQREVQTTYEELQSVVEELETTNEELQSTNEELETTNEELHSTNEELETMNEELQTTNEELSTVNAELRTRTAEVDAANRFLEAVLRTIQAAVVVVAPDLRVQAWNAGAEELWGLRADEVVGKHFLTLDIGLPVDELRPRIRDCLAGETDVDDVVIDAVNRRGRAVRCHVTVSPLLSRQTDPDGVMLVMVVEG